MNRLLPDAIGRLLGRSTEHRGPPEYAVVGLGNPGPEYEGTRHNAGFVCVDVLAERHGVRLRKLGKNFLAGIAIINDKTVALAKPLTFVNRSGRALREIAAEYGLEPSNMLVVYDEMDLEPGALRLRPKGGSGGHNGLKSIIESLSTQEFPRVRIGVGRPRRGGEVEHVLGRASRQDAKLIEEGIERAADAVSAALAEGVEAAMNRFNRSV